MHTFLFKVQGLHFLKEYKGIWEMWREREAFFNSFFWRPGRFFTAWMREGSLSWLSASRTQTPSIPLSLSVFVPCVALYERQPQRPVGYVWSQLFGAEELSSESETLADMWHEVTDQYIAHTKREGDREVNDGGKGGVLSHRLDRG